MDPEPDQKHWLIFLVRLAVVIAGLVLIAVELASWVRYAAA
jgi:hypothetical protein